MADEVKPAISQADWTGILAVLFAASFVILIALSGILDKSFPALEQLGTIAGMIVMYYFGKKS